MPVNIGDLVTNPHYPVGSINASNDAIAIWSGSAVILGSQALYVAYYTGGVWGAIWV